MRLLISLLVLLPAISKAQHQFPDVIPVGQTKAYIIKQYETCYIHVNNNEILLLECEGGALRYCEFDENGLCEVFGIDVTVKTYDAVQAMVLEEGSTYVYLGRHKKECPVSPRMDEKTYECDPTVYTSTEKGYAIYFYSNSLDGHSKHLAIVVSNCKTY